MLIGKRIKFEDLKDGMDVVVQMRDYYDGSSIGKPIRGRIVQENPGWYNGCTTIIEDSVPRLVYDSDNFWLVVERQCDIYGKELVLRSTAQENDRCAGY